METKWFALITGILLLLAALPFWPYGYYQLLRLVVSISALFIASKYYSLKKTGWVLTFGFIALLFNPVAPVYLDRATWLPIDLLSALIFLWVAYKKPK